MLTYEAVPGEFLKEAIEECIKLAHAHDATVVLDFNNIKIPIDDKSNISSIVDIYNCKSQTKEQVEEQESRIREVNKMKNPKSMSIDELIYNINDISLSLKQMPNNPKNVQYINELDAVAEELSKRYHLLDRQYRGIKSFSELINPITDVKK